MIVNNCPYLLFKTPELKNQWLSSQLSPALQIKILYTAYSHFILTNEPLVLTSLVRSEKLYEKDSGVHAIQPDGYGHAGDGSVKAFEGKAPEMIDVWAAKINHTFPYFGKPGCQTILIHDVGQGLHAHIQIGYLERLPKIPKVEGPNV